MIKIEDKNTVFCDVDDTLVLWNQWDRQEEFVRFEEKRYHSINVVPHKYHVEQLKKHHASGHKVVVWSQGGSDWAETVVKALGLEPYVDLVVSKPRWYYDDLPSPAFMGSNLWYNEKGEISNPRRPQPGDDDDN